MAEVRGDSRICVVDSTGTIRTVIFEEDFERGGYKTKGWTVVRNDWTKERTVRPPVDYTKEKGLRRMAGKQQKER